MTIFLLIYVILAAPWAFVPLVFICGGLACLVPWCGDR